MVGFGVGGGGPFTDLVVLVGMAVHEWRAVNQEEWTSCGALFNLTVRLRY